MSCCGGRRRTQSAPGASPVRWRYTDSHGGVVGPSSDERAARAKQRLDRGRGRLEQVDARGNVVKLIPFTEEETDAIPASSM